MSLANIVNKTLLLGVGLSLLVNAACSPVQAQNNPSATETRPAVTATYTPTAIPTNTATATPEPIYQEVQGVRVPTNVTIEEGIPMMIQGEEKLINYFWYGEAGQNFSRDLELSGNVYVIGDVNAQNVTCVNSPQVYVDANHDVQDLYAHYGEAHQKSGINNEYEILEGVHRGEPFYDEENKISMTFNGFLDCIGINQEYPVLLTSDAAEPTRWDWNFFQYKGIIQNAIIEYGRSVEPGDNTEISYSIIRHMGGGSIVTWHNKNVVIKNNTLYDTNHELIDIHHSDVEIIENDIGPAVNGTIMRPGIILDLEEDGFVTIYGNKIHDNGIGIFFLSQPREIPDISGNTFYNNLTDLEYEENGIILNEFLEEWITSNYFE